MPRTRESAREARDTRTVHRTYQREAPAHVVGTHFEGPPVSVEQALKQAGLDWKVDLRPMYIEGRDGKPRAVPARRAVVRDADDAILATVGKAYTAVQNGEALGILQPAIDQHGIVIDSAGTLGRGDRVWMMGKLPQSAEVIPGDVIEPFFLVMTGHNDWTPLSTHLMPRRLSCLNQMPTAKNLGIRLKHVGSPQEQLEQAATVIAQLTEHFKTQVGAYAKMARTKMSRVEMRDFIAHVMGLESEKGELSEDAKPITRSRFESIAELTKNGVGADAAPNTMWATFNAITEYVDHVRPSEVTAPRLLRQANESALVGANARLKARALHLATEYVRRKR